jgi:hypothetical protein
LPINLDGNGGGWQIIEEGSYKLSVHQCGTFEFFDEALAPIEYALSRNPLGFPAVPGFPNIHRAKTKLRVFAQVVIPSYRLWFRVNAETKCVHKLYIEIAPPGDMAFGESLCDKDDDIPF